MKFIYQRIINLGFVTFILLVSISCASQKSPSTNELSEKEIFKDVASFEKFIWSRNTDNSLVINHKNLKRILKQTKASENDYFSFLRSYAVALTTVDPISKELSLSERAYVSGYVIEYLYRCQKKFKKDDLYKNSKFAYMLLGQWISNNFNKEFKMHDYYGLKLLKKHHLKYYKYFPDELLNDTIPSKKRIID